MEKLSDNVYYIDCDAQSFRYIINVLRYSADICVIKNLSPTEFTLLQRTIEYLNISDQELESCMNDYKTRDKDIEMQMKMNEYKIREIQKEMDIEKNELLLKDMQNNILIMKLKEEIRQLKDKINNDNINQDFKEKNLIHRIECNRYRLEIGCAELKEEYKEAHHFTGCGNKDSIFETKRYYDDSDFPDLL